MSSMDQFDHEPGVHYIDEAAVILDIMGNPVRGDEYINRLARRAQATGRAIRSRSTQNPSVEIVEVSRPMDSDVDRVTARLRAALAEFSDVKSLLSRWSAGQPPKGSVLRWIKTFDNDAGTLKLSRADWDDEDEVSFRVDAPKTYVYVAVRANDGFWYLTGRRGAGRFDWDSIVKEIGDAECWLASEWTTVPAAEKPREESMNPEEWAKLMFGPKPVTDVPGTTNP